MAAALPIAAYDDGGLPELIQSGTSGLLVGHGDGRVGRGDAGTARRRGDGLRARRGPAARRVASDFAPKDTGAAFADLVTSMS